MSIKLICFEPWAGNNLFEHDSGFGDRIAIWSLAYYFSTIIKDVEIIVEDNYWPELLLIDLPNTTAQDVSVLKSSNNQLIPITCEKFRDILLTEQFDYENSSENTYYYLDFSISCFDHLYHFFDYKNITYKEILHNCVSKIKLKLTTAINFMENEFSDVCCIHLRRGLGTYPTEKFLNEIEKILPKETIDSYWENFHKNRLGEEYRNSGKYKYYDMLLKKDKNRQKIFFESENINNDFDWVNSYKIIPDSDYFNLIDNFILSENPNQKIYISSDIPKKYYSYYYDRYPNNIIDKSYYLKKFITLHQNKIPKEKFKIKYLLPTIKIFENVFDLMAGCYSKTVVKSISNWSSLFTVYKRKKVISADLIVSTNSLGKWIFRDYTGRVDWPDEIH